MDKKTIIILAVLLIMLAFLFVASPLELISTENSRTVEGGTRGDYPLGLVTQTMTFENEKITSISFWLRKSGDISGTIQYQVRSMDNDILFSQNLGDASSIVDVSQNWQGKWYPLTINDCPLFNEQLMIAVELIDQTGSGELTAYLSVSDIQPDEYFNFYAGGELHDVDNWDLYYQITTIQETEINTNQAPNNPVNPSVDIVDSTSVKLSIDVSDPDGDNIDIIFYKEDGTAIGSTNDIATGSTTTCTWQNLETGSYSWYTVLDDGTDTTTSDIYSFNFDSETDNNDGDVLPITVEEAEKTPGFELLTLLGSIGVAYLLLRKKKQ